MVVLFGVVSKSTLMKLEKYRLLLDSACQLFGNCLIQHSAMVYLRQSVVSKVLAHFLVSSVDMFRTCQPFV